jgi:hypothetical protein
VLAVFGPCLTLSGYGFSLLRHKAMMRTDERLRRTEEMLTHMRTIKMYAWEDVANDISVYLEMSPATVTMPTTDTPDQFVIYVVLPNHARPIMTCPPQNGHGLRR